MSILEFQNVAREYAPLAENAGGGGLALEGIDLSLAAGESAALMGPSGAGKTTLLCLAAGLASPSRGKVLFEGRDLAAMTEPERAHLRRDAIGLVFQNNLALSALPVWENAALPLLMRGRGGAEARREAVAMLERVGLAPFASSPTHVLSGGQRRRLGLARAMLGTPRLLLADEPTADLDKATASEVQSLISEWIGQTGAAALIVTHHAWLVERMGRILYLEDGQLSDAPQAPRAPAS